MRKTRHVEGIFGASHTYIHNMNKHIDILVITGLYISGIEGAKEVMTLRQQGVSHILNMVVSTWWDRVYMIILLPAA